MIAESCGKHFPGRCPDFCSLRGDRFSRTQLDEQQQTGIINPPLDVSPETHTFVPVAHQTGCKTCGYARGHHPIQVGKYFTGEHCQYCGNSWQQTRTIGTPRLAVPCPSCRRLV